MLTNINFYNRFFFSNSDSQNLVNLVRMSNNRKYKLYLVYSSLYFLKKAYRQPIIKIATSVLNALANFG